MAEDRLYEEANEDLSDKILDIGSGIAAAAGAAVAFYRTGGVARLADTMDKYSRSTLRGAIRNTLSMKYDEINIHSLKAAGRNIKREYKNFRQDDTQRKIVLDERRGTLGNLLGTIARMQEKGASIMYESLHQDNVVNPLREFATKQLDAAIKSIPAEHNHYLRSREAIQRAHQEIQHFV